METIFFTKELLKKPVAHILRIMHEEVLRLTQEGTSLEFPFFGKKKEEDLCDSVFMGKVEITPFQHNRLYMINVFDYDLCCLYQGNIKSMSNRLFLSMRRMHAIQVVQKSAIIDALAGHLYAPHKSHSTLVQHEDGKTFLLVYRLQKLRPLKKTIFKTHDHLTQQLLYFGGHFVEPKNKKLRV